jgi:hypothetical protein
VERQIDDAAAAHHQPPAPDGRRSAIAAGANRNLTVPAALLPHRLGKHIGGRAMTSLELALSRILELIEKASEAGNTLAIAALMQRKQVICAALGAPEQWR